MSTAAETQKKLAALRAAMATKNVDAYFIPAADEHINEYLPEENQRRQWATGFTGSAGDFLLTQSEAWLFTDSRYHQQADLEVAGTGIRVSKLGNPNQPSVGQKLAELARNAAKTSGKTSSIPPSNTPTKSGGKSDGSFRLGFDPHTLPQSQYRGYKKLLEPLGVEFRAISANLVDALWKTWPGDSRPKPVHSKVFQISAQAAGKSPAQKLTLVRKAMAETDTRVFPLTKLDQIAWLFNLRGQDVLYNPVFIAYAVITPTKAYLFTEKNRIEPTTLSRLGQVANILPYEDYEKTLKQLIDKGTGVLIDSGHTTHGTVHLAESQGGKIVETDNPVQDLKAVKNLRELEGMREANLRASLGKVRAFRWLSAQLKAGKTVTETVFAETLESFYKADPAFFDLSFNTISGIGANSSIVHYGTPNPKKKLKSGEFLLIDSGIQCQTKTWAGTTDDTRTIVAGTSTRPQKERYTAVLKAHIAAARQVFPAGANGAQIDAITRQHVWNQRLDYGHGTGHGVGAFLNVHEGPHSVRANNTVPLAPGMIMSIEPGYYEPGWGGIRLENLYEVVPATSQKRSGKTKGKQTAKQAGGKDWYAFSPLIYIPFDKKLIDQKQLSKEELAWLREYHQATYRKLAPHLSKPERTWLKQACAI